MRGGALDENEYRGKLTKAGFEKVDVEPTRIYRAEDARNFLPEELNGKEMAARIDGKFMSAFVRAVKPQAACCGSNCCASAN